MADDTLPNPAGQTSLPAQNEALLLLLLAKIEAKSEITAEAVRLAAIPFRFNAEILAALRGRGDGLEEKILERLATFSFVERREGFYVYTAEMRRLLLRQWQEQPTKLLAAHRRALAYFKNLPDVSDASDKPEQDQTQLAILYHTLATDPQAGIETLERLMDAAESDYRLAFAEQVMTTAEEQRPFLNSTQQLYLDYMQGRIDQLHGRWAESRKHYEAILAANPIDSLNDPQSRLPDLLARVRRELSLALVEQKEWLEALDLQKQALNSFEAHQNQREAAYTMNAIGLTYLGFAQHSASTIDDTVLIGAVLIGADRKGRIEDEKLSWQAWLHRVLARLSAWPVVILRLPILLYLASQLGIGTLYSGLPGVGQGIDWLVSRLFASAGRWLWRAQAELEEIEDREGLLQCQESLADLCLTLKNPVAAESLWRMNLQAVASDQPYRQARQKLGLARALAQQGRFQAARPLLEAVEPVVVRYNNPRRMAQTYTLLAACAAQEPSGEASDEESHRYHTLALQNWQSIGALEEATAVMHRMEETRQGDKETSRGGEDSPCLLVSPSAFSDRLYTARFCLPVLRRFQQVALIGLIVGYLLALFLGVQTQSITGINTTVAIEQPAEVSPQAELLPAARITFQQQLTPQLNTQIFTWGAIGALLGYLILYTALGLMVIQRTPLQAIAQGERTTYRLRADGITRTMTGKAAESLPWHSIERVIIADRFRAGTLQGLFSTTHLVGVNESGTAQQFTIYGFTNNYLGLQQGILARLKAQRSADASDKSDTSSVHAAQIYSTGFSLFRSLAGWCFLGLLGLLSAFIVLVQFEPTHRWVTQPLLFHYALSDVYSLAVLGISLFLIWWFLIQPLRSELLIDPTSPAVWWLLALGVGIAIFAILRLRTHQAVAARPDLIPAVLSLLVIGPALLHLFRPPSQQRRLAMTRPIRLLLGLLMVLLFAALVWYEGRELISFHHVVQGNDSLRQAERLYQQDQRGEAQADYQQARYHYERSLRLRADASVANSLGATLSRLGVYTEAITAYQTAVDLKPDQWAYRLNVGLAYEQQAQTISSTQKIRLYQQAIEHYDQLLRSTEETNEHTDQAPVRAFALSAQNAANLHLFRGSAQYTLGKIYNGSKETQAAKTHLQAAYNDYDWLIRNSRPLTTSYFVGRGYATLSLALLEGGRKSLAPNEDSPALNQAVADFEEAIRLAPAREDERRGMEKVDPNLLAAYTGLTWAHYYQIQGYDSCPGAQSKGYSLARYINHLDAAIHAISQAIALQRKSGLHYRTRAQLRYLLRNCQPYTGISKITIFHQVIADYDEALARVPKNGGWWYTYATAQYGLSTLLDAQNDAEEITALLLAAGQGYIQSSRFDPTNDLAWGRMAGIYNALRQREATTAARQLAEEGRIHAKDLNKALPAADRTIQQIKDKAEAIRLSNWFLALGDPERALAAAQAGIRFDQGAFNSLILLGWEAFTVGNYRFAQQVAQVALQVSPDQPRLYFNAGLAALAAGNRELADDWYQRGKDVTRRLPIDARQSAIKEAITDLQALGKGEAAVKEEILEGLQKLEIK